jgi:dTDP-4-dehydrorhamnose 3,5-epimerase
MIFTETKLKGAYVIETEPLEDDRGFFARTFCREEFHKYGLNPNVAQCNLSYNRTKGTLRGMHYQIAPREEAKLVSCVSGAIYDVIVDIRANSPTYGEWIALELTARGRRRMLYIPKGLAHGFQTLEDHSEVFYQMSESYVPEYARGIRWNDPTLQIQWPQNHPILSSRDMTYPDFKPAYPQFEKIGRRH